MNPTRWFLVGLGAVLAIAGGSALVVYLALRSNAKAFAMYAAAGQQLAVQQAAAQRRHEDSVLAAVGVLLATSAHQAAQAQHRDTVTRVDSGAVAVLKDSLRQAQSAVDSLARYPHVVAAEDAQIGDLTLARNNWRTAFNGQAEANASLVALHVSDTTFRAALLAHIAALPQKPRSRLLSFVTPKPYARAGWNTRTGRYLDGGVCLGACGP